MLSFDQTLLLSLLATLGLVSIHQGWYSLDRPTSICISAASRSSSCSTFNSCSSNNRSSNNSSSSRSSSSRSNRSSSSSSSSRSNRSSSTNLVNEESQRLDEHVWTFSTSTRLQNNSPLVETPLGSLLGLRDPAFPDVHQFLGVPYAEKPIRERRWQRVALVGPWNTTTDPETALVAQAYAPVCPQTEFFPRQSEDCLYLNIYTPARDERKVWPVMVFIYGGGFLLGSGSEHKIYDGSFIVQHKQNVVVVTLNYRLGALGFLSLDGVHGNFGLWDQVVALEWIQRYIAHFHGDPTRVTLWGQSAGATSVAIHLQSNVSSPLFQRAILQSPPLGLDFPSREETAMFGRRFAQSLKCSDWDCLRSKSVGDILLHQLQWTPPSLLRSGFNIRKLLNWFPFIDQTLIHGQLLSPSTLTALQPRKPVLIGAHTDDAFLFPWAVDRLLFVRHIWPSLPNYVHLLQKPWFYRFLVRRLFGRDADAILLFYPYKQGAFWDVLSDMLFVCPLRGYHRQFKSAFPFIMKLKPRYLQDLGGICTSERSCHAVELPYTFHSGYTLVSFSVEEHALSVKWIDHWTAFSALPEPLLRHSFTSSLNQTLFITQHPKLWHTSPFPRQDKCSMWDSLLFN